MALTPLDLTPSPQGPPPRQATPASRRWSWTRAWRVTLLGALALGFLDGAFYLAAYTLLGREAPLFEFWASTVPQWALIGVLLGPAFYLADRFPLARRGWRVLLVHVPAAIAFGVVHIVLAVWVSDVLLMDRAARFGFQTMLVAGLVRYFIFDIVLYGGLVGSYLGLEAYRRYQERVVAASRLEAELVSAQLRSLRLQLDPHFLFNSLNAISATILRRDAEHASTLIASLSHLLRRSLEQRSALVPLAEELELLDAYVEIERARLGSRLALSIEVERGLDEVLVPSLLLQPLVEDAIRYGVARRLGRGSVHVAVRRRDGGLRIEIADSGPHDDPAGDPDRPDASTRTVVDGTRRRLRQLFGHSASVFVETGGGGGRRVVLLLPHAPTMPRGEATRPGEFADRPTPAAARPSTL